jgi:hypothetical protein
MQKRCRGRKEHCGPSQPTLMSTLSRCSAGRFFSARSLRKRRVCLRSPLRSNASLLQTFTWRAESRDARETRCLPITCESPTPTVCKYMWRSSTRGGGLERIHERSECRQTTGIGGNDRSGTVDGTTGQGRGRGLYIYIYCARCTRSARIWPNIRSTSLAHDSRTALGRARHTARPRSTVYIDIYIGLGRAWSTAR